MEAPLYNMHNVKFIVLNFIFIQTIQYFEVGFLWKVSLKILNSQIIMKTFTQVKNMC